MEGQRRRAAVAKDRDGRQLVDQRLPGHSVHSRGRPGNVHTVRVFFVIAKKNN